MSYMLFRESGVLPLREVVDLSDSKVLGRSSSLGMGASVGYSEEPSFYRLVTCGDEAAFRALLTELGPMMMRLIAAKVRGYGDSADVQDLFQISAVRVWRWREKFDPMRGTLRTWVANVSKSVGAEFVRREKRRRRIMQHVTAETHWLDSVASGSADDSQQERKDVMYALLRKLTRSEREFIQLYLAGRTYPQIAAIVGCNTGAARTRMTRLRKKLSGYLQDEVSVHHPVQEKTT